MLTLCNLTKISESTTNEGLVLGGPFLIPDTAFGGPFASGIAKRLNGALVTGAVALRDKGEWTITLEVGDRGHGRIDRQLLVVDADSVTLSVRISEQARLQDGVCSRLDVRDQVRRGKGSLVFSEVGNQ